MAQHDNTIGRRASAKALAALSVVAVGLTACAGGANGRNDGSDNADGVVELTYTFWGDQGTRDLHVEVAESFSATHDYIEVEPIHVPGHQDYLQTIQTRMAGGAPPDVVNFAVYDLQAFGEQGALHPLTHLVERDWEEDEFGDNVPRLMDAMQAGEEYYGLPRNASGWFLYYNKDIFDDAGVPYPDETWTWDEVVTHGEAIAGHLGDSPSSHALAVDPTLFEQYTSIVWQAGGDFFNHEQSDLLIDSPESRQGFEYLHDLIHRYGIATPPSALTGTSVQELFEAGNAAMFADTGAHIATLQDAHFEWDVALAPSGPSGERWGRMGATGVAVPAASENLDEAWEFIRYINGPEGQAILASTGFSGPVRESVLADEQVYLPPGEFEVNRDIVVESYTEHSRIPDGHAHWTEISSIASTNLELYYIDEIDLDTALAQIRTEVEPLIQ